MWMNRAYIECERRAYATNTLEISPFYGHGIYEWEIPYWERSELINEEAVNLYMKATEELWRSNRFSIGVPTREDEIELIDLLATNAGITTTEALCKRGSCMITAARRKVITYYFFLTAQSVEEVALAFGRSPHSIVETVAEHYSKTAPFEFAQILGELWGHWTFFKMEKQGHGGERHA